MTWQEALDAIEEGKIKRFRWLCSDENPNAETREGYRALMIRKATGRQEPVASAPLYPSFARQAWNASKAAAGFAASGFALVSQEEQARRLAICQAPCEHYDAGQGRCRQCGCNTSLKSRLAFSHCPIQKW